MKAGQETFTKAKILPLAQRPPFWNECVSDVMIDFDCLFHASQMILLHISDFYNIPDDPRCPVKSFKMYMSRLNPHNPNFWQRIKKTTTTTSENNSWMWYDKGALGKNYLSNFMSRMTRENKLNKFYTNQCINLTSIKFLIKPGLYVYVSHTRNPKHVIRVAIGQGNSRSGKSQGILEFIREIWNFVESQGNSRNVREIYESLYFIKGCGDQLAYPKINDTTLTSFFSNHFNLNLPLFTKICYLKHIQACT